MRKDLIIRCSIYDTKHPFKETLERLHDILLKECQLNEILEIKKI